MSETVLAQTATFCYKASEPSARGGSAGQLIITNKRLIFIKYPGSLHFKAHDYSNNIEEGLTWQGSFSVSISGVLDASSESKRWGVTNKFSYLVVHLSDTDYCFTLVINRNKAPEAISDLVATISKAKADAGQPQGRVEQVFTSSPEVPRSPETAPQKRFAFCPECGGKLPDLTVKFCPFCGTQLGQSAGHS